MKQFVALFALAAALPAASTFPAKTSLDGKKTEKASIILGDGTLRLETKSGQAKEFRLDAIDTLSYSFSKQPRGKAAIGIGILCLPCGIATAFLKKKKHWLSWKAEGEGAAVVELHKNSWEMVALEIDALAPNAELERIIEAKK